MQRAALAGAGITNHGAPTKASPGMIVVVIIPTRWLTASHAKFYPLRSLEHPGMSWRVGVSTKMDKADGATAVSFGSKIGAQSQWRAAVVTVEMQEEQQVRSLHQVIARNSRTATCRRKPLASAPAVAFARRAIPHIGMLPLHVIAWTACVARRRIGNRV